MLLQLAAARTERATRRGAGSGAGEAAVVRKEGATRAAAQLLLVCGVLLCLAVRGWLG